MTIRINNWAVIDRRSPYDAPELGSKVSLTGHVCGHPNYPDDSEVTTSLIVGQREGRVVTASGHEYELQVPAAEYEALYPKCRERLLATLPGV